MSIVGENIKKLRIERGYTQKELAEMLNVSQNAVHNWETGKREPKAKTMIYQMLALDSKEPLMCNYGIHTNESNIIGTKIKECRLKKGLTQKQLGSLCDMTQQQIAQYENGKLIPKEETINKIANALESEELRRIGALRGVFNNQKHYDSPYNDSYNKFFNGLPGLSPDGALYDSDLTPEEELRTVLGNLLISEYIKCTDHIKELKAAGETESVNYYSRRSGEIARIYQQLIFL